MRQDDRLVQLDLYAVPATWARQVIEFPETRTIFARSEDKPSLSEDPSSRAVLTRLVAARDSVHDIVLECLIVAIVLAKQIVRWRPLLAAKYRAALHDALAGLIRAAYTPSRIAFRMYDWQRELAHVRSPSIEQYEHSVLRADAMNADQLLDAMALIRTLLTEGALRDRHDELAPVVRAVDRELTALLARQSGGSVTSI